MIELGLIGKKLSHSLSKKWFEKKFLELNLDAKYINFEIEHISQIEEIIFNHNKLIGLNVTIPFKTQIIPYLDQIDPVAKEIGAVNTVEVKNNRLKGYNTDAYGFACTLDTLPCQPQSAIIFGNGGATKAVKYILKKRNISHITVSRKSDKYNYENLTAKQIQSHQLLINTTPVGMFPNIDSKLSIPENGITSDHMLIDLIYNPEVTSFMQMGISKGAFAINGQLMLEKQADRAWELFIK